MNKKIVIGLGVCFVAVLLFFLPLRIPYKIAFPLLLLACFSIGSHPWQMTAAFFLSAAGDLSGNLGNMPLQIGFFALAHICLILFFLSLGLSKKKSRKGKRAKWDSSYLSISLIICIGILYFVLKKIVPWAPSGIIQKGTLAYACVICMMLFTAMQTKDLVYMGAAGLFVLSDTILAWSLFLNSIDGSTYLIMIPYYLAQMAFFYRSPTEK